jgi:hypothetical protein
MNKIKKSSKKLLYFIIPAILVVLVLGFAAYHYKDVLFEKKSIEISYYDANNNLISSSTQQALIGTNEGVKYIKVTVNALNKDTTNLDFELSSISPAFLSSAITATKLTIAPNQYGTWISNLIDVSPLVGTTQTLQVTIKASSPIRQTATKTTVPITLKIDPDPVSNFDITIDSGLDSSGINPSCNESWVCSDWNTCTDNTQSRICTDANTCGTTNSKPSLTQSCTASSTVKFRTNAADGNSYISGTWIAYDSNSDGALECYTYSTTSSGSSAKKTVILTDLYSKEWSYSSSQMYLYTGLAAGSYQYRIFKSGSSCELSSSPIITYVGKEMYV